MMASFAQWQSFVSDPLMSRPARKKNINVIYQFLYEWYRRLNPNEEWPMGIVHRAVIETYEANQSYADWAVSARNRLRLRFATPKDKLKARGIKIGQVMIGCPTLEERA
jgi:hypothetical protein